MSIDQFFATARERHAIWERRFKEQRPAPWTTDPIYLQHRFCNVYRELDTTTIWFDQHVRGPLRQKPEVLLATVVFRLFNRIQTGEAMFLQTSSLYGGKTAFEYFLETKDVQWLHLAIHAYCGAGPYVTGSYIVQGKHGMPKLDGVLWVIDNFAKSNWRDIAQQLRTENNNTPGPGLGLAPLKMEGTLYRYENETGPFTLEDIWFWLRTFPYIGPFVAYELVSDLRHTALLDNAPDIMTWANAGPGAIRGLDLVFDEKVSRIDRENRMRQLLHFSQSGRYWPPRYPPWEMREVEHWLCEYAKYRRIQAGGPGTRQRFKGGNT